MTGRDPLLRVEGVDASYGPVQILFGLDVAVAQGEIVALLGTNGARNYAEDGITVTHEQTIEQFRGLRGTGPVKAFRTAEQLIDLFGLRFAAAA